MTKKKTNFKYGSPMDPEKVASRRKRLPQYDECLREFLNSGSKAWIVDIDALPSKDPRVVLSSLKWRIQHFQAEYKGIKVFLSKNQVYLERVDEDE
jgi:hypothetical protein